MLARNRAEDANLEKSRFLAAASHDLRQPLHALSLFSTALGLRAPDGPIRDIAEQIEKALASLAALFDSLLDISRLDAGAVSPDMQPVSVPALFGTIEGEYRPVALDKGLAFEVEPPALDVHSDPVLLARLIRNLVDNAVKYTAAGGVALAAEPVDGAVRISVRDTGPGIPPEERERIYNEFYQIGNPHRDRALGLGLGLSIARQLARLLGLSIELESEPGRGSTFSVTLPYAADAGAPPASPAADDRGARPLARVHVLVIDDETAVRVGMRSVLESWGCRVATCNGWAEAQQLLDEHAPAVDIIVADFRLRQNESGVNTIRRLRERLGDVPALLVTGDTAPERLREAQASGLPLLHKPVQGDRLVQAMLAALQR